MSKKRILIISYSYMHSDPRVRMQYEGLKADYEIFTLGLSAVHASVHHFFIQENTKPKKARMLDLVPSLFKLYSTYERMERTMQAIDYEQVGSQYDLIICNDVNALSIAHHIAQGQIPIWADLHEYAPLEYENFWWWNLTLKSYVHWQCKKYLKKCQAFTTVCSGLANKYAAQYNIKFDALIYNAPIYEQLAPSETAETIRLVHHGGAQPQRKLEKMLAVMEQLGAGYSLHFYLTMPSPSMKAYCSFLAKQAAEKHLAVFFHEAVATDQIVKTINQYDIGLFILEPVNFNYLHALPNKFFEYIQARLAIAVSPNPEMKDCVEKYELGIVSQDYTAAAMAESIKALSKEKIAFCKSQSNKHAQALSFESNREKMINIANELTNQI